MNKSVLLLLQSPWGDEMKQASARKNRVLKSVVANMSYTDIGRHINKLINVS